MPINAEDPVTLCPAGRNTTFKRQEGRSSARGSAAYGRCRHSSRSTNSMIAKTDPIKGPTATERNLHDVSAPLEMSSSKANQDVHPVAAAGFSPIPDYAARGIRTHFKRLLSKTRKIKGLKRLFLPRLL